jgi:Spy/CpxP family protein refolding chaperone
MKKLIINMAAIALVAVMTVPATAQMRMRGEYGRGSYYAADITKLRDLNLTSEQITKLSALRDVHLLAITPLRDQMYSKSIELKSLWLEQIPDHKKIAMLQKDIQTMRDVMLERVATYRMETMNILTVQQQEILETYKEKRGYGKGMRGKGGSGRQDN